MLGRTSRCLAVLAALAVPVAVGCSTTVVAGGAPTIVIGMGSACARQLRQVDLTVRVGSKVVEEHRYDVRGLADLPIAAPLKAHLESPDTIRIVTATFETVDGSPGETGTSYREGTEGRVPLLLVCACLGVSCVKGYQCEQDPGDPSGAVCAPLPVACGSGTCGEGGSGGTGTGTTTPGGSDCAGVGDGLFCGGNGVSGQADTLYECSGGDKTAKQVCTNGCQVVAGDDDRCKSANTTGCAALPDGYYCGNNGLSSDANTLYHCEGGIQSKADLCPNGCQIMPSGNPDHCISGGGPCSGKAYGLYCGNDGLGADPDTLYLCSNGNMTKSAVCTYGCQINGSGSDDACKSGGSGACVGKADGLYCGNDGLGADANTLYLCSSGNMTVSQVCTNGCQVNAAGTDDACKPGGTGPCATKANGLYCGNDGLGADANTLYLCSNGNMTVSQVCANGCQINPAGTDDACKAASGPCSSLANGLYCGNDGLGLDANTLYKCYNGALSTQQSCTNGCQINPSGTDDACKAASGPCTGMANGLYCGNDGLGLDANTLYKCYNGAVSTQQSCTNGCQINPSGTDDACKSASGGGSCSGLANGLYCGSDKVGGNANTLYLCSNGAISVYQVCSNGCTIMPSGYDDKCS